MKENNENKKWLSKDDFIKALEEKGIEYDKSQIEYSYFPWKEVEWSINNNLKSKYRPQPEPNHTPCPLCGKPSEELLWIDFDYPHNSLSRIYGLLTICQKCKCQVQFIPLPIFD